MESTGTRIRHVRSLLGLTQEQFAKALGVTRGAVGNWELGNGIKNENLKQIAEETGASYDWLALGRGSPPGRSALSALRGPTAAGHLQRQINVEPAPPPRMGDIRESLVPVYSAVQAGPGFVVLSTDPVKMIARPESIRYVKDGYVVIVSGESMVPRYEPGEMVVVNPRLPVIAGRYYIFATDPDDGEFKATLKRLVSQTATHWHVEQLNPAEGEERRYPLAKREWPHCLRVVGTVED